QLVDRAARPGPAEVGHQPPGVEFGRDLRLALAVPGELLVDPLHDADLALGAGDQDNPVRLQALLLPAGEDALVLAGGTEEHPAGAVPGRAALAVAGSDQAALPLKPLGGQLPAVLAGHGPLDALDDGRGRPAVVLELLGAVVDFDAGPPAEVLVVGAL